MSQQPNNDRRRYPRHRLRSNFPVELRVEVSGDKPALLVTRGMVADISCGGLKCGIDFDVPVGTRVDVRFPQALDATPALDLVDGRVVRTESLGGVPDQVAIAFAQPFESLELDKFQVRATPTPPHGSLDAAGHATWPGELRACPGFAASTGL